MGYKQMGFICCSLLRSVLLQVSYTPLCEKSLHRSHWCFQTGTMKYRVVRVNVSRDQGTNWHHVLFHGILMPLTGSPTDFEFRWIWGSFLSQWWVLFQFWKCTLELPGLGCMFTKLSSCLEIIFSHFYWINWSLLGIPFFKELISILIGYLELQSLKLNACFYAKAWCLWLGSHFLWTCGTECLNFNGMVHI